jgi:hypothetical protein
MTFRIWPSVVFWLLFLQSSIETRGQNGEQNSAPRAPAALEVWDTIRPSDSPTERMPFVIGPNWKPIPIQVKTHIVQGDAGFRNGKILGVLRKQSSEVDVFSDGSGGPIRRMALKVVSNQGQSADHLDRVNLVENTRGAIALEATYKTAKGEDITAKFRVRRGDVSIQVEPGVNTGSLKVVCPSRFVVLPDFFADDIVIDARTIPPDTAELPSDNFVMHLTGDADAISMCVFENRKQDVRIALSGQGEKRTATGSEIAFEGKKIWAAILEVPLVKETRDHNPKMWHIRDIKTSDTGQMVALDWKMPFAAQWRCDFTKSNGLTDSWEMLLQQEKGDRYLKPSWLGSEEDQLGPDRKRWNTVLGRYLYPCWAERDGRAFLQPLETKVLQFQGPAIFYPIGRVKQTPLDAYTVMDVMRNTLGVGPCEYILDLEGQKAEYRGRATCSVRDELGAIYEKNRQKEERARVDQILDEGLTFVKHIRGRITRYVEFGHQMRDYLAGQKKRYPELADIVNDLDQIAGEIDNRVSARQDKIQTPAHVAAMNEEFRKNVRDDYGPDALAKCKQYAHDLVVIGDNQDELSGECRWVVKALRQKAGLLLAQEPRAATIATEIRARTQEALRFPANHEGAHH